MRLFYPLVAAVLFLSRMAAISAENTFSVDLNRISPAPGHAALPVVFWAHYMPQLGTIDLAENWHAQGGTDTVPFLTCHLDNTADYEQHIRSALDAGINGFQMLSFPDPAVYQAARAVREKDGRIFYVNPQWCDQHDGYDKAIAQMAKFAREHRADPHVFRINGKQVFFFYGPLAWAEGDDPAVIARAKRDIASASEGCEVLFMPTPAIPADRHLFDRPELGYGPWSPFTAIKPGKPHWLENTAFDGLNSWNPEDVPPDLARQILERVRPVSDRFLFIPGIWPGYDSSNRARQAIHCSASGLRALRDNLGMWVRLGIRQFDFVTWNDVNETMLLPSSRSPFGFSRIIRWFHELAVNGHGPWDAPRVVVSYDSETLYGDDLSLQFLVLPEQNALSCDYLCQVRYEDHAGKIVTSQSGRGRIVDQGQDELIELRMGTTEMLGRAEVLSPVVDVVQIDRVTNTRRDIHRGLRLPPITLRMNKLQAYTPYVIALDAVEPGEALSFGPNQGGKIQAPTGSLITFDAHCASPVGLRRLQLAEGRLGLGAFRQEEAKPASTVRLFLRLRSDGNPQLRISLAQGRIIEAYTHDYDIKRALLPVQASSLTIKPHSRLQQPNASGWQTMVQSTGAPALLLETTASDHVLVALGDQQVIDVPIAELAIEPSVRVIQTPDGPATIRLELTTDAVELNQDYPVQPDSTLHRTITLDTLHDGTRYFHAWALSSSDRVAYSRPLIVVRKPRETSAVVVDADTLVNCQFIRTQGTFDDFVDSTSSAARNPFSAGDVVDAEIPARQVPYIRISCDEGAGFQLNDSGTSRQLGRAWVEGPFTWITDGWDHTALRLQGGAINLRSMSFPHGAYTFALRLRGIPADPTERSRRALIMQDLRIGWNPDGHLSVSRPLVGSEGAILSKHPIAPGAWTHLVVTYDLRGRTVYVDGEECGFTPLTIPTYRRTHSNPTIRFSAAAPLQTNDPAIDSFAGDLDQIEIIGAALNGKQVGELYRLGRWLAK